MDMKKHTCILYLMLASVVVAWGFGLWWVTDEENTLLLVVSGTASFVGSLCAGLLLWPEKD